MIGVAYIGEEDVYDIETEKYHTFFANGIGVHNCQDLNFDFIPQIEQTLGSSEFRWQLFFGTARGSENTIQRLFEQTTQSEFAVRCPACGHWNIPSLDHDALGMIQPKGIACARTKGLKGTCGKLLDVEVGQVVHRFPDRATQFVGMHIPQTVVKARVSPVDYYRETIYDKLHGVGKYPMSKFLQEIMGISTEMGNVAITPAQIKKARVLDVPQEGLPEKVQAYRGFSYGADWGGSEEMSFTVGAGLGFAHDGRFHALGAIRPMGIEEHLRHYPLAAHVQKMRRSDVVLRFIGADAQFVGSVQNKNLAKASGVAVGSISYGTTKKFILPHSGTDFTVDRTTLMYVVFTMIKDGLLLLPKNDWFDHFEKDLLSQYIHETQLPNGAVVRSYRRKSDCPDDYLHALGYGLVMLSVSQGLDLPKMIGLDKNQSIHMDMVGTVLDEEVPGKK